MDQDIEESVFIGLWILETLINVNLFALDLFTN